MPCLGGKHWSWPAAPTSATRQRRRSAVSRGRRASPSSLTAADAIHRDLKPANVKVRPTRKLEDAEYIVVETSFAGRVPRTEYRLTAAGKRALEKYLAHMEALIKAVRD